MYFYTPPSVSTLHFFIDFCAHPKNVSPISEMRLTFAAGPQALECGMRNSGCGTNGKGARRGCLAGSRRRPGNQAATAKKAGTRDLGLRTRHWGWNEDHSDDCTKARLAERRRSTDAHGETGCQAGAPPPPAEGLKWCEYPWAMRRGDSSHVAALRPS